jgi:Tfp pilus assembly protein PilF
VTDLPVPSDGDGGSAAGAPSGEVYDWYHRGRALLEAGDAAAAAQLLSRAVDAEPDARSIRETLARAQFDARQYAQAKASFAIIIDEDPSDHYAQFGLGLAASRLGDFNGASRHLAIATALRPDIAHYGAALHQVRATLAAREEDAAAESAERTEGGDGAKGDVS